MAKRSIVFFQSDLEKAMEGLDQLVEDHEMRPEDITHAVAEHFGIEIMEQRWDVETEKQWPKEVWDD